MHSLSGPRDDLSEFLSPEEAELFSLWDANRVVLRQTNFGSFVQTKTPVKLNDLL